jgi:hypothetical protein
VTRARDIPGWNHDIDPWAEWIAPRIPRGGTYLEVGVFLGASLAKMGELRPDINLIAVDPWIATPRAPGWCGPVGFESIIAENGGDLFLAFLSLMLRHAPDTLRRTRIIRGTAESVSLHTPVDFLFIDGDHSESGVRADLRAFAPLVHEGGIVAGHDYHPDFPGVVSAVNEYFGHAPIQGTPRGAGSVCWWVET